MISDLNVWVYPRYTTVCSGFLCVKDDVPLDWCMLVCVLLLSYLNDLDRISQSSYVPHAAGCAEDPREGPLALWKHTSPLRALFQVSALHSPLLLFYYCPFLLCLLFYLSCSRNPLKLFWMWFLWWAGPGENCPGRTLFPARPWL